MRVLIVTQIFLPEMGALANRMYPFVRELVSKGHEVIVATGMPNYPKGIVFDGYRGKKTMREQRDGYVIERTAYYTVPRNKTKMSQLASYLTFLRAAYESGVRAGPVDIVFVTSPPMFPVVAAMRLARRWKAKLVLDLRDLWPDEIVSVGAAREGSLIVRLIRTIERAAYRRADLVACTTHAFIEAVVSRGVPRAKTLHLPNGADLQLFYPREKPPRELEGRDLTDRFVVMYSGLLGIKHGLEAIIGAAKLLADMPSVLFVIVGEGPRRAALEATVSEMGLQNVLFIGERKLEELPSLLSCADVCVTNLLADAYLEKIIPVKLFEYMACARPVVAAVGGEAARIINEAAAGIVVPPGDASAIAEAVRALYDAPERCARMGAAGRAYVERGYSRERTAQRLEVALQELMTKSDLDNSSSSTPAAKHA